MSETIEEVRQLLACAREERKSLDVVIRKYENDLRERTAVAWLGEVSSCDGEKDGSVMPASIEVPWPTIEVRGDRIYMRFAGNGYDRDALTLIIGGEEQCNMFTDQSGVLRFRAFKEKADAEAWVAAQTAPKTRQT